MPPASKPVRRSSRKTATSERVLYLYGISEMPEKAAPEIGAEGIDGLAVIEAFPCENYLCWLSRVRRDVFADHLTERMQDLEWLATAGLRHQRAVAAITQYLAALPARFGTVFLSEESLADHIKHRRIALQQAFRRVADADEWGIKVFAEPKRPTATAPQPSTGSEYLKRKAELLQPRTGPALDDEGKRFVAELTRIAVASSPGGKASAGQPGLVWHGAFLIRRSDRKKLDATLKKYAAVWKDSRRIDCSGPWPPYSFVGEDVR